MAEGKVYKRLASKWSRVNDATCYQLKKTGADTDRHLYFWRCGLLHCSEAVWPIGVPYLHLQKPTLA
jgi:hypothetical protein